MYSNLHTEAKIYNLLFYFNMIERYIDVDDLAADNNLTNAHAWTPVQDSVGIWWITVCTPQRTGGGITARREETALSRFSSQVPDRSGHDGERWSATRNARVWFQAAVTIFRRPEVSRAALINSLKSG